MSPLPVIHEPSRLICPQHLPIYFSWRGLAVSITRLAASGFSQRKKKNRAHSACRPPPVSRFRNSPIAFDAVHRTMGDQSLL